MKVIFLSFYSKVDQYQKLKLMFSGRTVGDGTVNLFLNRLVAVSNVVESRQCEHGGDVRIGFRAPEREVGGVTVVTMENRGRL